ncbi:MAG: hypothetical protein JXR48_18245, partial [Candidatus Delongbacteria bacterium]|nr:hypothetical protein [Candidatus Delongbacteria bacterium]
MIKRIINKFIAYLVAQSLAFMSMPVYAVNNDITSVNQQNIQLVDKTAEKDEVFSRVITPTDSARLEYMGVILDIPKGAVDQVLSITIEKLNSIEMLPGTMTNSTGGAIGYRFGPHGTQFKKDILVSLPFDKAIAESETALSNLFTYFYNDVTKQWERLERVSVDKENYLVTSRTNHFTDMINTTLQLPELPQGIDFNLNSIKDLKAADPTEGVPRIKGLSANNNGTASFQIPLRIPQ